ncbi:MAG TPA: NAD(P)/FAD-dependent oxidoreductase [Solirubrobacterales bacterium]
MTATETDREHLDVLIIGAGISGIAAARNLARRCPQKSYAILESRGVSGGTWDLYRYPGVRSDSDVHTLGFGFKPWKGERSLADGDAILAYVREAAAESGVDRRIRYHHRVVGIEWSRDDGRWRVEVERTDSGETVGLTCGFVWCCSGYFAYDDGYLPDFEGTERFAGRIAHPHRWPEDLEYEGKRVVVIGSGATAVSLVPALAESAEHVTMLQRSPSYLFPVPGVDPLARALRRFLPPKAAYSIVRWKDILTGSFAFWFCRRYPDLAKRVIRKAAERSLPADFDFDRHLSPSYNPWEQRPCALRDGDLYQGISEGRVEIVTDTIETFTESGLRLTSGAELEADVIVTATGFNLEFLGGMKPVVDGEAVDIASVLTYKGMMASGVPNLAFTVGYTNASWTLKVELTCDFVCRLLNHMDANGLAEVVPMADDPTIRAVPIIDLSSGYVQRSLDKLPQQGSHEPWRLKQNYLLDSRMIRHGPIEDGALRFAPATAAERRPAEAVAG